jgi:hypothetical protein
MPQANLVDKPPQMGDATKENFGAAENMLFVSCDTLQVGECRKDTDVQKRKSSKCGHGTLRRIIFRNSRRAQTPNSPGDATRSSIPPHCLYVPNRRDGPCRHDNIIGSQLDIRHTSIATPTQDSPPCSHPTHRRQNAQRHCAGYRNLSGRWRLSWRRREPRGEWEWPSSDGEKTVNSASSFFGTAKETMNESGNPPKPCPRIKPPLRLRRLNLQHRRRITLSLYRNPVHKQSARRTRRGKRCSY